MVSLQDLNEGVPTQKPWLTPVCYNLETLNLDTNKIVLLQVDPPALPPEDHMALFVDKSGVLSTTNYSGTTTKYITKVVQPVVAGPFVPQPLNSTWTVSATTGLNPLAYASHNNTLITADPSQMVYSVDEGKTWVNSTSNIAFNNSVGFPTYGYSSKLQLAVFYSQTQYGTSLDGRYWTLVNQVNAVPVTYASYDLIRYNEFYNKWYFIGDTQQLSAPGNAWGTFTVAARTIASPCYRLAINPSSGLMVSVTNDGASNYVLYSNNGGITWLATDQTQKGYSITWVAPWNKFVALLNGFYCTSSNGLNWTNTTFGNIGLEYLGPNPLSIEWISQLNLLVVGLRRVTGTYTPLLAYQSKLNEVFKVTPITGGAATSLEIVSLVYISSSGGLTVAYYTGEVFYSTLNSNAIVPSATQLFNGNNTVCTSQYSTFGNGTVVNNTMVETIISGGLALGSLVFHPLQPTGAVIMLDFSALYGGAINDVLTLRYKMNGTTILTHTITLTAAGSGLGLQINSKFVVRIGNLQISSTRISDTSVKVLNTNVAHNPAITNVLSITGQWSTTTGTLTPNSLYVAYNFSKGGSLALAQGEENNVEESKENNVEESKEDSETLPLSIMVPDYRPRKMREVVEESEDDSDFNMVKSPTKRK